MKSSFSAAGCEEVYTSLDHSLLHAVCCVLGVCDYQNCGITIIVDYCLESITINRLIGALDHRYRVSYDVVQQIKRYYYYTC